MARHNTPHGAPAGGDGNPSRFVRVGADWGRPDLELSTAGSFSAFVLAQLRRGDGELRIPAIDFLMAQLEVRQVAQWRLLFHQVRDPQIVTCRRSAPENRYIDIEVGATGPTKSPTGRPETDAHATILVAQVRRQSSISVPAADYIDAGDDVNSGHRWIVQPDNNLRLGDVVLRLAEGNHRTTRSDLGND